MAERSTKKSWVLIVEDDVYINKAYAAKFAHESIDVKFAMDGEEAIKTLRSSDSMPALVLLDLMLPKKNGFEVLKDIKSDPRSKSVSVIVLTNLGQETDAKKGVELGAAEYLVKADTKIDEIVKKVKGYLER
ncbi:MAG: response regulator [Candidatus Taylorbacteria bacterium]|nr:response regulator [Candidatus Taylorbacteria bacterium]